MRVEGFDFIYKSLFKICKCKFVNDVKLSLRVCSLKHKGPDSGLMYNKLHDKQLQWCKIGVRTIRSLPSSCPWHLHKIWFIILFVPVEQSHKHSTLLLSLRNIAELHQAYSNNA